MADPEIRYAEYVVQPTLDGPKPLSAKFFLPAEQGAPLPLMVWLHAGGFRTGSIESDSHMRLGRLFNARGYGFVCLQYRFRARPADLTGRAQAVLPDLAEEAAREFPALNQSFAGARALAAVEDCAAFFGWIAGREAEFGCSGQYHLGGASSGGMTALNTLFLKDTLDLELPSVASALILSGAFAYPSRYRPLSTRILALHGTHEEQIPVGPIRALAAQGRDHITLLEDEAHQHGDIRLNRSEPVRRGVRRFVEFDRQTGPLAAPGQVAERPAIKDRHKICILTCVKNEGPFLLEWIAHNRAIGVTDFIIFSNDCTDGTDKMLDRLQRMGIVHHFDNPSNMMGSLQHLGLALACGRFHKSFRKADYVLITDADEFIQIRQPGGTLNSLLAETDGPDVLSLTELLYGFGGVERYEDRLITEQFLYSDGYDPAAQRLRRGVKSLMRVHDGILFYGNHRPRIEPDHFDRIRWLDGSGQPVTPGFIRGTDRGMDPRGRDRLAHLNHYSLRSGESMLVKFERGDAVRPQRMREKYFRDRNKRVRFNDGFAPRAGALREQLDLLLADPELADLHGEAVIGHRKLIETLKDDAGFQPIWQQIRDEVAKPLPKTREIGEDAA